MSRGFTGGRSLNAPKRSAADAFIRKAKGQGDDKMSQEARYDKLVNEKMEAVKAEAKKSTRYMVNLPGTSMGGEREISKSAQQVIDKLAKERAKKQAKKAMFKNMTIRARHFMGMQGGRIDKKGRIYGPDGRYIAYVCKKTGKVKNRMGGTVCYRYSDSTFCDYKIIRYIQWMYDKKRMKSTLYAVNGFTTAGGGVYGSVKDGVHGASDPGAGLWGTGGGWGDTGNSGGGGLWGPSDNSGGGWGNGGGSVWG